MKDVVIVGAGDLGKQFQHMIENYSEDRVIGWIDDTKLTGEMISGKLVIGGIEKLESSNTKMTIAIAIGYKHLKFKCSLIDRLKLNKNIEFYSFIHPSSFVDLSSNIEPGVFIYPNVTVDMNVIISTGVILNNSTTISHDSIVKEGAFLAPNVTLSGNVEIRKGCFIGAGTVVKDGIYIGEYNKIGSGSNIFKNIIDEDSTFITKSKIIKLS